MWEDSEIGELYEILVSRHGAATVDKLITDGKATAVEVGNCVYVKMRQLEWSNTTDINRNISYGGVSQGVDALQGVDLGQIADMFDEILTSAPGNILDIGDARLLRTQQDARTLAKAGNWPCNGRGGPAALEDAGSPQN